MDTVWREAKKILNASPHTRRLALDRPSYSEILGVGLFSAGENKAATRLVKTVRSEAAFVVWKLRNARRIREEVIHPVQARATLRDALLRKAKNDFGVAKLTEKKKGPEDKAPKLLKDTWKGLVYPSSTGRLSWLPSDHG
jgi:hypothetical protein